MDGSGPFDPGRETWSRALRVAALLAVDPHGLGGVWLRGWPGPARDRWLAAFRAALGAAPLKKAPLGIADDRLLGGLDLTASLAAGRAIAQRGVLAEADGGALLLPMAERLEGGTAAKIAAAMDRGAVVLAREGVAAQAVARFGVVALDEGLDGEAAPAALIERLAFHVDLGDVRAVDAAPLPDVKAARAALPTVEADPEAIPALVAAAGALGVMSLRAPILALRAARVIAALDGAGVVAEAHLAEAVALVLAPRATQLPPSETAQEPQPPQDRPEDETPKDAEGALEDRLIEAASAALPPDLLAALKLAALRGRGSDGRSGAKRASARRGRPIGARAGALTQGARLALVETLRAAAPWQSLRNAPGRIAVTPDDFRIKRLKQRDERVVIFAVDASGSAALHRLNEAKGAVEHLLAEAYRRRDLVALVAFRGEGAHLLLPPTRSLTRAKRELTGLPGGGGTPLAAGLDAAMTLAEDAQRRGRSPIIAVLTDGRGNIARDGTPGRARAREDAEASAARIRAADIASVLIDVSPRPRPEAQALAAVLGALYQPLPHADARMISGLVDRASMT